MQQKFDPVTLKINRVPDPPKDQVCTKFCQNPLKDVDSRVITRMLRKDGRTVALLYPFATSLARRGDNKIIRSVIKFNWIN